MSRKTSRSLLSILLVFCMMFSMLPVVSLAAENEERDYVATVYVDGTNGENTAANDGSTEAKAKKGMTYAYQALYKAMGDEKDNPEAVGRIIVLNDVSFADSAGPTPNKSKSVYAETHACTVVVTSKTGAEGLVMKNNYINLGPTVYENITLTKANGASSFTFFCANGYPLVIGEGVTCKPNASGSYMSLMGGVMPTTKSGGDLPSTSLTGADADNGKSFTGDTDLTVMSGTWRNIYAGSYKGTMVGDAKLTMTGGTVTYKAGATFTGTVDGNVELNFTGVNMTGNLYGGRCGTSGKVTGSAAIALENVSAYKTQNESTNLNGDVIADAGVQGNVTLTIKDSTVEGTVSGADTLYLTASEGKTLSIGGGKLEADSFTGGGTLVLGDGVSLKADAVTGETTWKISGTPYNLNYISGPAAAADDAFTYVPSGTERQAISTIDSTKYWGITGGEDVVALKLTVPEDVSLVLCSGFSTSGTQITPDQIVTDQGITTYVFISLPSGNYCYTASGDGYYSIKKNIYYSEDEAAVGQTVDCNPGQRVSGGFQQTGQIGLHTDEVMDTILNSDPAQDAWEGYEHVFTTPVFEPDRAEHQQTTHEEMMDFLAELDDDDNMYTYIAGYTPVYNYEMPVTVFTTTDLSGAETLEEAAELVKANGKPTIHYQAMIHPNEPAGGEAALAMIQALDGDYGDEILDKVNVYVIPRINGDGAYVYQRANVAQNIDMNRDHMYVQSKEVEIVHQVYNLFLPQVTIDGHEFSSGTTSTSSTLDDVQVGTAGNLNSGEEFTEYSQAIVQETFAAASALGLRPFSYGSLEHDTLGSISIANTVNNAIGRPYYALYGSLSFLIETRGISSGLGWMERRVLSQYVVAESIIDYVGAHAAEVQSVSDEERQRLVEVGGTYEDDDVLVLKHDISGEEYYEYNRPTWNLTDGSVKKENNLKKVYFYDVAKSSRTRPTAYVISKGESWAETVTGIMDKNGIEYYQVEAGSAMLLQQYKGSATSAVALDEQVVIFEDGAYVFPMDQIGANVLAMTMEPDVLDSKGYNGTLLQSKIVAPDGSGMIPIYRHIHDLENGQVELVTLPDAPEGLSVEQPAEEFGTGTIVGLDETKLYEYRAEGDEEYTAVAAGSTQISGLDIGVYYVRYSATSTELASEDCALEVINNNISEYVIYVDGVSGSDDNSGRPETAPVCTLEAAYAKLDNLMKYAPEGTEGKIVLVDDVTVSDDVSLPAHDYTVVLTSATGTEAIKSDGNIDFNGDTRIEKMGITLTVKDLRYIAANGNELVIGEEVVTTPAGSYYYCVAGGGNGKNVTGDTDLTIQSGTWRNIYAAGYKGSVTGDVTLNLIGGNVTGVVQNSYNGTTNGNVEMNISNAAISGIIYGGNTKSGNVNGDVTITLGENVEFGGIYTGSRDAGSVTGTVNVLVDGAEVGVDSNIVAGCANKTGSVGESVLTLKSGSVTVADTPDIDIQPAEGFELVTTENEDGSTTYTVDRIIHTVIFMDGSTQLSRKGISHNVAINKPADPTKAGYTFAGWYTDAELTVAYDFNALVVEDITLYAKWTENIGSEPDDSYYEPTYRVEAAEKIEGGSISVSPKYAEKGDTVSVTVKPDEGYQLDQLIVTDRKGNELAVTAKNGKYTFKMPAGKVTVSAAFVPVAEVPFTDVSASDWYYEAVKYAYDNEIMAGMGADQFAPNDELLRSMVAQVLYNLDEDRYTADAVQFSDVIAGEWYVEAINWAVAEGIFAGYGNGTFGTQDSVTREQLAVILRNYAASKGYAVSGSTTLGMYADADMTSGWAVGAMEWAVANGILRVTDGLLTPSAPASRGEVAYAMMQFCELFKN